MTLWKNTSEDTLRFPFDLGTGKRELITLAPSETVEIPSKYDSVVHTEAPQLEQAHLVKVKLEPMDLFVETPIKTKRTYKKKDKQ